MRGNAGSNLYSYMSKKKLRSCLVWQLKHMFLVFKQYYMYFHIFFHLHVFQNIFLNKKTHVFKCMYQIPLKNFANALIYILWGFQCHFKGLKKMKESYICQSSSRLIESVKFFDKLSWYHVRDKYLYIYIYIKCLK